MKAQKCPKCGFFNKTYGCEKQWIYCLECSNHISDIEPVELIDWEYELIINNEYLKK